MLERVGIAAHEPLTARLMRTPLQVTIMSLLLERRPRAPQDRYGLFEAYYNTLYDREVGKDTAVARLLDEQRVHVDQLHEQVGLILQTRAETAGDADAAMPLEELQALSERTLTEDGVEADQATRMAGRLVNAATDRLVLIVPRAVGTVGFELRSLQELMAARAVTDGPDEEVLTRIRRLTTSAHWRNTWLFAASRIFATQRHQRHAIVGILGEIDNDSVLSSFIASGARLAIDMLDDDLAAKAPLFQRLLVERALTLLNTFPGEDIDRAAKILLEVMESDTVTRTLVIQRIEQALAGATRSAVVATRMLGVWADGVGITPAFARQRISRLSAATLDPAVKTGIGLLAPLFPTLASLRPATPPAPAEDPARVIGRHMRSSGYQPADLDQGRRIFSGLARKTAESTDLTDPEVQGQVVSVLDTLPMADWPAGSAVYDQLVHWSERRPTTPSE